MLLATFKRSMLVVLLSCLTCFADRSMAATPSAEQALSLTPIQRDVDYDVPSKEEAAKCTVVAESKPTISGWIVRDAAGRDLRQFLDTNQDNKVDQWCYYKNGIEVYRDVDANYNGKADQYRWLGTAGIRWGEDRNEDGQIDSWKMISAEEASAEVIAALREQDLARFQRLLLTKEELKQLGLGEEQDSDIASRVRDAAAKFSSFAQSQQLVGRNSQWSHFGGIRPGVIPAGTNGSTKDFVVYDNVMTVVETDGKHMQLALGTLVQAGDTWRVIDLPRNLLDAQANTAPVGVFFNAGLHRGESTEESVEGGLSEAIQKLMTEFEAVEKSLASASTGTQRARLNQRRAELIEQLIDAASSPEERANWARQYADTLSAAIQSGEYDAGLDRLKSFYQELAKSPGNDNLVAYAKYRHMNAVYSQSLQDPKADFAKIQEDWLKQLEQFVEAYPKAEDAADALLQLALAQEFAGKEDDAKTWYQRILKDFASSDFSKKAEGAIRRLDCVGRSLQLRGRSIDGKTVDLSAYRGKVVVVHYWATWCEPCMQEMKVLKNLQAKYGRRGLALVGINLDNDPKDVVNYVRSARLSWPQLYEEGGLDSRLANELGILTLPAMFLIDQQGQVLSRNVHAEELDEELGKHLK